MQDFLTLAASTTLYSLIAFTVFGYVAYVWQRTAPIATVVPASEFLEGDEIAVEGHACPIAAEAPASLPALFAAVDAIMSNPIYAADAPATPAVQRSHKVSPTPIQEVIDQPKRKRGRPRKVSAA